MNKPEQPDALRLANRIELRLQWLLDGQLMHVAEFVTDVRAAMTELAKLADSDGNAGSNAKKPKGKYGKYGFDHITPRISQPNKK